jgi:2-keto-4-pentenoate hydratase
VSLGVSAATTGRDGIDVRAAAAEILAAQDAVGQLAPFTSRDERFDLDAAYRVAAALHALRLEQGDVAAGRKIGFTNAAVQQQYGVTHPIWGYVYRRTLVQLDGPGTFSLAHMPKPARIEPEIAFHFHASPPAGGYAADILACVDWIAHGFEIVQSPYPDWKFKAPDTVAANGLHGALLIGSPRTVQQLGTDVIGALERFSLLLYSNGQLKDSGTGANVLGHPLNAIVHLVRVLTAQGNSIQAGEVITTGTVTAALPIAAGETWKTEISGIALPGIEVTFV